MFYGHAACSMLRRLSLCFCLHVSLPAPPTSFASRNQSQTLDRTKLNRYICISNKDVLQRLVSLPNIIQVIWTSHTASHTASIKSIFLNKIFVNQIKHTLVMLDAMKERLKFTSLSMRIWRAWSLTSSVNITLNCAVVVFLIHFNLQSSSKCILTTFILLKWAICL